MCFAALIVPAKAVLFLCKFINKKFVDLCIENIITFKYNILDIVNYYGEFTLLRICFRKG